MAVMTADGVATVAPDVDVPAWRRTIRQIAARYARHWAWHWRTRQLVDDLEADGWIALLEAPPGRERWAIQNAIQEALSRWLWGCKRGRGPTRTWAPLFGASWDGLVAHGPDPLTRLLALERWRAMTPRERRALECQVWPVQYVWKVRRRDGLTPMTSGG